MEGESQAYNIDLVKERVPNTVFISVLFVLGLFGNSTYLFLMINADKKMTSIRCFSVVLSIIDLIGIISGSILGILQNTYVVTFQSDFACKTLWYISSCAALLSSLVITMISIERYRQICRLSSRPFTKKSRFITVLLLSCLVCFITIPVLLLNGKRAFKLTRQSINVTTVIGFPTTSERDVESFLSANVTTWSPLSDTNKTNVSPIGISDKTNLSSYNETFVTGFSCCALNSENQHLRNLESVYDITLLVTVFASLLTIAYAYTYITKSVLKRRRNNPLMKKDDINDIYVSIKHTGLHCAGGLRFSGLQEEISENSVKCEYNIPIKAISQQGRFMPSQPYLCGCCLPSSKLKAGIANPKLYKLVISIISLFMMSYIPSVIFTFFQDHHSDTSWSNTSAFRLNLNLTVSRSYLLAHALNSYVAIYFDNFIRQRLVELVSRLCRYQGTESRE